MQRMYSGTEQMSFVYYYLFSLVLYPPLVNVRKILKNGGLTNQLLIQKVLHCGGSISMPRKLGMLRY